MLSTAQDLKGTLQQIGKLEAWLSKIPDGALRAKWAKQLQDMRAAIAEIIKEDV